MRDGKMGLRDEWRKLGCEVWMASEILEMKGSAS